MKQFDSFELDTSNQCLWRKGAQIALAPKPFAVLRYLVENPARLVTHDELLDALWPETYVQPQVLRTYVLELRKVLGDDAGQTRFIQTLTKRGYRFVAPVMDSSGPGNGATPGLASTETKAPIVQREDELGRLNSYAQRAAAGQRQIVFITGGSGIGKTALAEAFCRQVGSTLAADVAHRQCIEGLGKKEQYYPVMEAMGQLCASETGDRFCRLLAKIAPAWLPRPWRKLELEASVPAQPSSLRMLGDLCAALEELALEKPLILVFEDVQWADDSTLELISALARRRSQTKLMLLATYGSPVESSPQTLRSLKHDLLMHRLCAEIALAPLSRKGVQELLCRQLGQEPPLPGLDSFVYQRSEGNPLFVIAILEHLIAQRFLVRKEISGSSQWEQAAPFHETEAGVPEELAQMIELEIGHLSSKEQHILEAASLISVAFPAWAVAAALESDVAEIEDACDELAQRLYFLRRAGHDELPDGSCSAYYVFAHGLYRDVLYQRQPAARRAKRHIRIAQSLSALFAGREADVAQEIAIHYEAAGNWADRSIPRLRSAAISNQ